MDGRVALLLDELGNAESIDPLAARKRIVDLIGAVREEQDRVSLLMALEAVIGLAIRQQEGQGIDSQPLRNALLADKRSLVLQEAMGSDELIDPSEQLRILQREIAAGRMEQDDFYQLAVAAAAVFGPRNGGGKPGFLKRIFG